MPPMKQLMKHGPIIVLLLVTTAGGVGCESSGDAQTQPTATQPATQPANLPVEMGVPDTHWPPIYFEPVDELADGAGWAKLRDAQPREGVTEIRVWVGFGLSYLRGVRLVRTTEGNHAEHAHWTAGGKPGDPLQVAVDAVHPEHGWDRLWANLGSLDIRTLPDARHVYDDRTLDGVGYMFEVLTPDGYRTYLYGNPQVSDAPQALAVARIMHLLSQEFSLDRLYQPPTSFNEYVRDGKVVLVRRGQTYGGIIMRNQKPSQDGSGDVATYEWVYRDDGDDRLDPGRRRVRSGRGTVQPLDGMPGMRIAFGPFELRWSVRSDGVGYLYYPDPADELSDDERQSVAFTDAEEFDLRAADERWQYRGSYTDFNEEPIPPRRR